MALQVLDFRLIAIGTPMDLGTTDSMLIARNGIGMSTGGFAAVFGSGNNHWVMVEGVLAGGTGIQLGDDPQGDFGESVHVSQAGVVSGTNYGVYLSAYNSFVTNDGLIDGRFVGVYFRGAINIGSQLENHGTIHSQEVAVYCGVLEKVSILNTGTISGGIYAISGSNLSDSLRNLGQIFGTVDLLGGDDSYDGRGGTIEGTIYGGAGNDIFRVGAGIETIDGGAGIDTLDFRTGGAIKVALDLSFANTRAATDDGYINIENIIGSRSDNDVLAGDAGANALTGLGGNDVLLGKAGDDTLTGGAGADKLTGGTGNDRFVFNLTTEGGDTITDFNNIALDDDAIVIAVAGFGGLVAGALASFQFQIRADNLAQDADDRFIFNTTDHTLWFDVNGSGAAGLTLLATLQASAVLSSTDILLV